MIVAQKSGTQAEDLFGLVGFKAAELHEKLTGSAFRLLWCTVWLFERDIYSFEDAHGLLNVAMRNHNPIVFLF
ncbi:hypothetical protein Tco_0526382 [Tanacetum coccineum]